MKFVATVILYNPEDNLIDNIKSYCHAVDKVYVIDNSKESNAELTGQIQTVANVEYIAFGENRGISHALNLALDKAIADDADYLLTMDQDTAFRGRDAYKMKAYIIEHNNHTVGIYAANTTDYTGNREVENVKLALTSGNMINCRIIKQIGAFDEALFIDWVDQDVCYRLLSAGYEIYRLNRIRIEHHLGVVESKNILGFEVKFISHKPIRYYYMTRNKFYVLRKNRASIFQLVRFVMGTFIMLMKVVMLEENKGEKIKYMGKGVHDFFCGKIGKMPKCNDDGEYKW